MRVLALVYKGWLRARAQGGEKGGRWETTFLVERHTVYTITNAGCRL